MVFGVFVLGDPLQNNLGKCLEDVWFVKCVRY